MLGRTYKLKKDKDFQEVFKKGRSVQKGFLRIKFLKNELTITRFAFLVGIKIAKKAAARNKIKRRLEEAVRLMFSRIKPGFDIIVLPASDISQKTYQEVRAGLTGLFKEGRLLKT